jgi:predicted Zn finger-like uncharacterized protein
MQIDCPGCAKSYHIVKAALGPNGRRVACPRCDAVWFIAADGRDGQLAPLIPTPLEIPANDVRPRKKQVAKPAAPISRPHSSLKELCAGAALLVSGMALLGLRAEIVRLWPPTSTVYAALGLPVNLRGLELRDLHTVSTRDGSEAVLGIEGKIANIRSSVTKVPPIELSIRDPSGHILYSWTATSQKRRLAAGETIVFRAQLAEPPAGSYDVLARFATPQLQTVAAR